MSQSAIQRPSSTVTSSWFDRIVARYRKDHQHPINHVLHVWVGWPLVGASLFLLPFRPFWAIGLFLSGYGAMFTGHFLFEKNTPTIFKHPTTPFVMAWSVTRELGSALIRTLGRIRRA